MLISAIPAKFQIPWGNSAGAGFIRPIPQASQIGIQAGAASLTDGFPPVCFLPIGAGGTPPWGADFNGILNQVTLWNRWQQAGAPAVYDSAFQTAIGGYPIGSIIQSATTVGLSWCSLTDGNTTNPDTGGAGWGQIPFGAGGLMATGDIKWRPTQETLLGWVKLNTTTLGSASSGAAQLASATAANAFSWIWTNFSNTLCPVSGGRGANPAADFAANKTIATPDFRGFTLIGMDTMGGPPSTRLSGVPVVVGSATQPGSYLGEFFHALITAELAVHAHGVNDPTHNHGVTDPTHQHSISNVGPGFNNAQAGTSGGIQNANSTSGTSFNATNVSIQAAATGISIQNAGSGTAHNTVQTSITGTWYLKL